LDISVRLLKEFDPEKKSDVMTGSSSVTWKQNTRVSLEKSRVSKTGKSVNFKVTLLCIKRIIPYEFVPQKQ
jgi:hypothetical protein